MPWPSEVLRIAVLLLVATVGPPGIRGEENVGCLFSEKLCLEQEWCYDDLAFGRCLRPIGDVEEDDLYRYNLEREDLHELSSELSRLFALGYRWSHGYTQCRLQAMLYAFKHDMTFEPDACSHLSDNDLEGALKALEGQVELDPQEVAIIKYTPSVDDPHASFADEVYYPPINRQNQEELRRKILAPDAIDLDMPDPYANFAVVKRAWIPQMRRRSPTHFQAPTLNDLRDPDEREAVEFLKEYRNEGPDENFRDEPSNDNPLSHEDMNEMYPIIKFLNDMHLSPKDVQKLLRPENSVQLLNLLERFDNARYHEEAQDLLRKELNIEDFPREKFPVNFNTPTWESSLGIQDVNDFPESRVYYDEGEDENPSEYGSGHPVDEQQIFRGRIPEDDLEPAEERQIFNDLNNGLKTNALSGRNIIRPAVYSEGGVVWTSPREQNIKGITSEEDDKLIMKHNLDRLLERYNLGFKRPERLDVKKPGPPFNPQITDSSQSAHDNPHKSERDLMIPSMMKKEPRGGGHPYPDFDPLKKKNELNFIHIYFKNQMTSWSQGLNIIGNISKLLRIERGFFVDGRAEPSSVVFRVIRGLNANEVAKEIEAVKDKLREQTGMEITSIEVGDREKGHSVVFTPLPDENQFYIVFFMVCGVLAAMIVASVVLIFIRRHIKSREKLQGLSRPDTEASKDYQDLCRSRMATKGQPAGETVHGRITSLSRESEQSPSSRSSTSSWSEEPALHNMDISTGHMVLSYMEDHLKNKDRLEQEWVALCAYVAEPSESNNAKKKENKEKNRYQEVVPYDHARVVLNELSNLNGSDYINASSITDHDPRNPAYIATQGPLPHTAPDFWQLIWEQGAVVIVMLTRLTEGGTAMCHRYWPEEGSELYHIYEVHLVSEHIWCDDYLVRSFYLKNIRTGETRTVTQFHFLSWPETGVPSSTKSLLEFRRKVNKSYRGRSCPIVVHCSDGAGRAGTYCLIDMVLSRMAKGAKEIDIAATLEHLRDQRPKMVATKQQFEFVLTAVAEEVHAILKALPPQPNPAQAQEKEK
ncbi:tyrosine phosphatase IA-2 isoform X1 [Leptinotarsa decemlineata]|uniref:tyrosine phosphatase IA-2 isoform X1 n=2 Tax=Leptinotarsa decemlineata TaxID=7539 RepID=UPI003D30B5A8